MTEKIEKCETCKFWQDQKCKRYPPEVNAGGEFQPSTSPTDFCGEYQPRQQALSPSEIKADG